MQRVTLLSELDTLVEAGRYGVRVQLAMPCSGTGRISPPKSRQANSSPWSLVADVPEVEKNAVIDLSTSL